MDTNWWIVFFLALYASFKLRSLAAKDMTSAFSAIDGGLMLGSVCFYLRNLHRAARGNLEMRSAANPLMD